MKKAQSDEKKRSKGVEEENWDSLLDGHGDDQPENKKKDASKEKVEASGKDPNNKPKQPRRVVNF